MAIEKTIQLQLTRAEIDSNEEIQITFQIHVQSAPELKKTFSLTPEFCDCHAENLYSKLKGKYLQASKEDFLKLCQGLLVENKIDFKKQSELITLAKWFKSKGFLEQDSISWTYLKNSCTFNHKAIKAHTLRSIAGTTLSPAINLDLMHFAASIW